MPNPSSIINKGRIQMKKHSEFAQKLLKLLNKEALLENADISLGGQGIQLEKTENGWRVRLKEERMLGRAAMLLENYASAETGFTYCETPVYRDLGVMIDCSRNAAMTPDSLRRLMRMLCLMGYSSVQLYMEDMFELEGYPYFGYGRGGYSVADLQALDAYAADLGLELVPAIQTLAHLGQALRWEPMAPLCDVKDILLVDDERSYAFLDAIFQTMRRCFRTRRINIGMDEAHLLGLGQYLHLHGYVNRTELMLRHFQRVHALANQYGFAPMLWSDMFFRLASGGEYYVKDCRIDPSVARLLPADTTLLYWDYYTQDQEMYVNMFRQHKALTPNTTFACGAWRWTGYSPCNHFSMSLARASHPACQECGIENVLVTMWGDNGAECSTFAVLPCMQQWAELCWQQDEKEIWRRFSLCTGGDWNHFLLLDEPVFMPGNPAPGQCGVNPSKTMLYEDILLPLFSHDIDLAAYVSHLQGVLKKLEDALPKEPEWTVLFREHISLCKLLIAKCGLQRELRPAWQARDVETLRRISGEKLPLLFKAVEDFVQALHAQWYSENRAAGLDVLDLQLGGIKQRILTLQERLEAYLAGRIDTVQELDMPLLPYSPTKGSQVYTPHWRLIASPSVLGE